MGAFYGAKICSGEVNPKTGNTWTLEDVPVFWRGKVADWLEANSNGTDPA